MQKWLHCLVKKVQLVIVILLKEVVDNHSSGGYISQTFEVQKISIYMEVEN